MTTAVLFLLWYFGSGRAEPAAAQQSTMETSSGLIFEKTKTKPKTFVSASVCDLVLLVALVPGAENVTLSLSLWTPNSADESQLTGASGSALFPFPKLELDFTWL